MSRVVPSQVVELIDKLFTSAATQKDQQDKRFHIEQIDAAGCATIVQMTDAIPSELISLGAENYSVFIASLETLRTAVETWKNRQAVIERIPGLGNQNPITLLRNSLAVCPDEAITPSTAELNFIPDPALRENLRKDISASNQALNNAEWKAATVLAGATIEALLLWALDKEFSNEEIKTSIRNLLSKKALDGKPSNRLEDWSLHPLIEVAKDLDVIKDQTAVEARLARNFRNLIHPGKATRLNQVCDRGTALLAVAALEHVIRDFSEKF